MASEKQLEANRRNAQRSTGPKTREGKDRVRFNALTHGLRADAFDVLPYEDPERFAAKLDDWNRDYLPANEVEAELVRKAAVYSWKLDRADRYENAVLSRRILDSIDACDFEGDDSSALVEAATLASFDPSIEGERLRRYQFALHRALLKTLETLWKLRREQAKPKEVPLAEGEPMSDDVRQVCRIHGTSEIARIPIEANPEHVREECRGREIEQQVNQPIKANPTSQPALATEVRGSLGAKSRRSPWHPRSAVPIKANSAATIRSAYRSRAKRTDSIRLDFWPIEANSTGWLDASCEKV